MTLGAKQRLFTRLVAQLIDYAYSQGFELTFSEAYRTPEQAALNAKSGSGISNSLHTKRLAVDLNLFIGGVYQDKSEAYRPLGEFWESLGGSWGGRFSKPDGNHFSQLNHSCQANCYLRIIRHRVEVYSRGAIRTGAELTVDYGETMHPDGMGCRCGVPGCRSRI